MAYKKLFSIVGYSLFLAALMEVVFFNLLIINAGLDVAVIIVYLSVLAVFLNAGGYAFVDWPALRSVNYSQRLKLIYGVVAPKFLIQLGDYKSNTLEYLLPLFFFSYVMMPLAFYQKINNAQAMSFAPLAAVVLLGAYVQIRMLFDFILYIVDRKEV